MANFIYRGLTLFSLFVISSYCVAQSNDYHPHKNPFGQPEILKYKAPVQAPKNNTIGVDKFNVPQLKLTATLISVSEPMVIVNGEVLRIGEKIEGMQLKEIDEGRAIFRFKGKYHVFSIDKE